MQLEINLSHEQLRSLLEHGIVQIEHRTIPILIKTDERKPKSPQDIAQEIVSKWANSSPYALADLRNVIAQAIQTERDAHQNA